MYEHDGLFDTCLAVMLVSVTVSVVVGCIAICIKLIQRIFN